MTVDPREGLGGRVEAFYYLAGETAALVVMELPDDVGVTAFAMAVAATGTVSTISSRAVLTAEEVMRAMAVAASVGYRPPTQV